MPVKTSLIPTALVLLTMSAAVDAQVLGSFTWQTQPYCNVVTLTIIQQGNVYQVAGKDDLCGAGTAPITGTAVAGGSGIALGFSISPPAGVPVHVSATFNLTNFSGTWSDDFRNGGTFAFAGNAVGPSRPTLGLPISGGNGEGVGGTICTSVGVEVFTRDRMGNFVDSRFSFIIPGFANGQIRATGSIRNGTSNLISVEHPRAGAYCLVFSNPQPSQLQAESTVVSIHAEQ